MAPLTHVVTAVLLALALSPRQLPLPDAGRVVACTAIAVGLMVLLLAPAHVTATTNTLGGLALTALYVRWLVECTADLELRGLRGMRALIRKPDPNRFAYNVPLVALYRFRMARHPIAPPQPSDAALRVERDRRLGRAARCGPWVNRLRQRD